ncbi:winged helix-turn-helix domain-containing protein [Streptomyces sp. NBC_00390]|uniref:AfsR/SARP family transcriptional regulator n=1 Tax=Streptomyces sp. NBC_00390 TaxID=2975736 RepID=UPI002E1F15D5
MHFRVLGPVQVLHDDGTPVALGGARLRALLTVLALRAGRAVPVGVLVDEVWDGDPPADAVAALQALVGRLRRALGHGAVVSAEGGYRLCAERDEVDLHRFDRLAGEGARALAEGDVAKAATVLDDALGLWREPVLADLPDRAAQAARLESRRLDARRARLSAELVLGGAETALPELAALCAEHPLDEPLHALRIRALRDAGRAAQALAAYEEVRRTLADTLGADPGTELLRLQAELLKPAPVLPASGLTGSAVPTPAVPTPAVPVPGMPVPGMPATAVPAPTVPTPAVPASAVPTPGVPAPAPGNLRARLTSFVGREPELHAIRADLGHARLVTLLGPGGAGKTRLSQEAAERAAAAGPGDPWPDGVWLAELAPVDDPDTVSEAVLGALGARETVLRGAGAEELRAADRRGDDALARLTEHCARRRMLLLLDNCEHVVEAAATLAQRLLECCPGLTVLATSREPLGVPGELVRPVDPLPDPAALRLLAERGASARPGFRVDEDEATAAACAEICRRLDGLPLAIELAAARLRMLTPRQIADRLDDRFRLLTTGSRTALPRQQTLRAVVDWSWDLLDAPERAVLRRLSVFAGGCDLSAAESVCAGAPQPPTAAAPNLGVPPARTAPAVPSSADPGGSGPPAPLPRGSAPAGPDGSVPPGMPYALHGTVPDTVPDVADALGALIDKSLVVAVPAPGGQTRYRLLETVAEYAAERLDEARERDAVERLHLAHYRELARTTDPLLREHGQRAAVGLLELEYENLRTALRRAVGARDEHEALCLLLSLAWYWQMKDLRADARHWSQAVGSLGPDPFAPPVRPAPPLHERCIDAPPPLRGELLDEARRQVALIRMVSMDHSAEEWTGPDRREWLHGVVTAYGADRPQTCRFPASLWFYAVLMTGDSDQVMHVLDETVRTAEEAGYAWELATALQIRANVLANRTVSAGSARSDADRSLEIYRRLGDAWGVAEALSSRGESHERSGAYDEAAADYRAAVEYAKELGAQNQAALLRARLAGVLIESGHGGTGEAILREVLAAERESGAEAVPAARMILALWLGCTGRTDEARRQLESMREYLHRFTVFEGIVLGGFAWLDVVDGRHAEALEHAREALRLSAEPFAMMIAPQMPATHVLTAARALAGLGGEDRGCCAARLLGAYEGLMPARHFATTVERENRALAEQAARALLGDAAYEAAYAEGGGLSLEEATALV